VQMSSALGKITVTDFSQRTYSTSTQSFLHGMFWGTIVRGTKGPCIFIEKEWGTVTSEVYNTRILSLVQEYCAQNPGSIFMQDNAPAHRSIETRINLL
jgi:hypothetical protein